MAQTGEMESRPRQRNRERVAATGISMLLLRFLDRNLIKLSPLVRDAIGLGVFLLLFVIALHATIGPTLVRGRVFVMKPGDTAKSFGKDLVLLRGHESYPTSDEGVFVLPMRGMIPVRHRVVIRESGGAMLGQFTLWGPWPVASALETADYTVMLSQSGEVSVSRSTREAPAAVFGISSAFAQPVRAVTPVNAGALSTMQVHLQDLGDIACEIGTWCGTKWQSRRLEGMSLQLPDQFKKVEIEYACTTAPDGSLLWVRSGTFCGSRGRAQKIDKFAARLVGEQAGDYELRYQAHISTIGDTAALDSGAVIGVKGKAIESLRIDVVKKSGR